ncbi:hypothetical protein MesoLj113c_44570 [Mesorhizobium sp. 113-3-9]|nr:hypothetical protein MesoLj113c_44570 [Mesorhizobium sp. 113-3-9]
MGALIAASCRSRGFGNTIGLANGALERRLRYAVTSQYLNHRLECPHCLTIRLRIPADAQPDTWIVCSDCGEPLGTWDDLQTDFEKQGGNAGVFRLDKGRIKRIE